MRYLALISALFLSSIAYADPSWTKATLVEKRTINEWCRHCPDWNKTRYSFRMESGLIYVGEAHQALDVTMNGESYVRFEKDGHVGDHLYVKDDSGKEQKLRIVEKIAK
jgi:hypothetical protein